MQGAAAQEAKEDDDEAGVPSSDNSAVGRQRWALESIYSFVTRQRGSLPPAVHEALLGWLMQTAFFKRAAALGKPASKAAKGKANKPPASLPCLPAPPEIQELCVARFFSLLEALSTRGSSAGGVGEKGGQEVEMAEALPSDVADALQRFSPMHQDVAAKAAALAANLSPIDPSDVQLHWPVRAHLIW